MKAEEKPERVDDVAVIRERKDKNGVVTGYKVVVTLGRDDHNKKVYVSTTIQRPEGLTPKKEEKEIRRLADEWEHEQRELYELNKSALKDKADKKRITLREFIDDIWIKKHVQDGTHTPETVAFYIYMSKDIKKYFGDKKLADINKNDILDYILFLRTEAKTRCGNPYSKTTIQHHFNTIRNILEYAVYVDYKKENPCAKLKTADKPKSGEREIDFLEEEEAIKFIGCLESDKEIDYWKRKKGSYLRWKTMVNIMIVTGLRRGEIVGLQWGDIDRKNYIIKVRRNVTPDTSHKDETDIKEKVYVGETKGKKIRKVPISRYLADILDEFKAEQEQKHGKVEKTDFIFCREDASSLPMYPTVPTRMMQNFIKRHGLPNVSPHDLRHTAASLAIQSGANVKEIQALMGHKDAATTLKFYAGISEKAQRDTIDGIEGILRPKKKEDVE